MSFIEKYYKLEEKLFEEEKYKDVKLNSKVAYAILKYMVENNINIKIDKDGKKYIENSRDYIKQKMNLSINTITSIYKELIKLDLIEEKWIEVGKPNIVYIKNCESEEAHEKHNICETVNEEENYERVEKFTIDDLTKSQIFLVQNAIKCSDLESVKENIMSNLDLSPYSLIEKIIISNAIKYLCVKNGEIVKNINDSIIKKSVYNTKNHKKDDAENVIKILIKEILKIL